MGVGLLRIRPLISSAGVEYFPWRRFSFGVSYDRIDIAYDEDGHDALDVDAVNDGIADSAAIKSNRALLASRLLPAMVWALAAVQPLAGGPSIPPGNREPWIGCTR